MAGPLLLTIEEPSAEARVLDRHSRNFDEELVRCGFLSIALVAATLAIPSVGYSQDQGLVDGKVGPNLESSTTGN
jgi:hypothetical protein